MPRLLWQPGLDIWNAVISAALSTAVVVTAATGNATVSPVASTPTISQPAAGSGLSAAAPGAIVGQAPPDSVVQVYDGDKKLGETKADQVGNYRFSLPTLAPGQHTLSTRVTDANGNPIASSAPIPVTVTGGPVAQVSATPAGAKPGTQPPTFTDLPSGTQWPSGMPVMLSGTAPPGSKVQVFANDKLVGETVAGPDGKWSLPLQALPPGDYFLTTRAYGPNGALLGESAPAKVTVVGPGTPTVAVVTSAAGTTPKATVTASLATTATRITTATLAATTPLTGPAATAQAARPAFTGLTEGAQLPPGAPLAGTAAPRTKIQLFNGDKQVAETTAGPDGKWSLALPALAAGTHSLTARAVGPDGSVLASSAPLSVAVGGTPAAAGTPAQPVFVGLAQGLQLPPGAPLAGTATPGTKIRLFDGDKQVAETTAGPDGKWSLALPALAAGTHSLTARAVGPDGSVLGTSAPLSVAVGGTPAAVGTPAQPVFVGLAQGLQLPPGAPLAGTATPGTKIQLFDGDKQVAETTAGPDGKWSLTLPALAAGAHSLTARAVGSDGSVLGTSAPLSVAVGGTPGTAAQAAGTPGGAAVITGTVRPTGVMTGTPRAAQPAGATTGTAAAATAAARPGTPAPAVGTAVAAATAAPGGAGVSLPAGAPIFLMGMADPGAKLRIFSDNTQVGETVSDALGQWRLMLPALQSGTHELVARIFDAAGKLVTSSAPLTVTILGGSAPGATPGAAAPTPGGGTPAAAGTPSAQVTTAAPPEIIGPLAGSEVPATSPGALEGKAEPGSTIRIYDGDKLVAEVVVGPDGTWRVMLPQMADGPHTFVVRVVSPDGSEAAPSAPVLVVVRPALVTTPVPAASGAAPAAGGPSVSSPAAGGAIQSSQPLLSGSAAPGSTVRIYDGNVLIDETKADSAGRWHFVPPIPLAIGKHTLRVASAEPDGMEAPAEVLEMVVAEGATGLKPLMFSASYGKAPSPFGLLQGTAPPGAIVVLYDGDVRVVKIPVDANGQWQYALPARTRLGLHQYSIDVTSSDGTTIYRSQPVGVRIGAAPPPFLPRTGPDD